MSNFVSKRIISIVFGIIAIILLGLSFQKFFLNKSLIQENFVRESKTEIPQIEKSDLSKTQDQNLEILSKPDQNLQSEEEFNLNGKLKIEDLTIDFKFKDGEYLLDVMNRLKNSGQINFEGKEFSSMGFFVEEINGKSQNPKERKYWRYYVNEIEASVGISNYKLKNNDSIYWKLEAYK